MPELHASSVFFVKDAERSLRFYSRYLKEKDIKTTVIHWGTPTLVIHDVDDVQQAGA